MLLSVLILYQLPWVCYTGYQCGKNKHISSRYISRSNYCYTSSSNNKFHNYVEIINFLNSSTLYFKSATYVMRKINYNSMINNIIATYLEYYLYTVKNQFAIHKMSFNIRVDISGARMHGIFCASVIASRL